MATLTINADAAENLVAEGILPSLLPLSSDAMFGFADSPNVDWLPGSGAEGDAEVTASFNQAWSPDGEHWPYAGLDSIYFSTLAILPDLNNTIDPLSPGHIFSGTYKWLENIVGVFKTNIAADWSLPYPGGVPGQGVFRAGNPSLPSTLLARADTITNLSATGALLTSYAGDDTIIGGSGNDTLDGGTGADSLVGGWGDDVYFVNVTGDKVVEAAGQGFDTVYTSNTFTATAGASIERIVATGTGAISITGNGLAMAIEGNSGINTLDDGNGAATLKGGAGNDVYVVHNATTQVVELSGEGYDGVRTDLSAYTLGANLETLTHLGATAFQGTGNSLSNALTGGTGSDTLNGAGGNDVLTGGLGADHFRFSGLTFGQDQITDFLSGTDVIELSGAGFGLASLAGVQLVADGTATASGQATLHYYANGGLSFDANGGAAGDAIFFATLSGHPSLAISDFQLV